MVRNSGVFVATAMAAALVWLSPVVVWACGLLVPSVTKVEYQSPEEADDALVHDAETMFYVDRGDGRWTVYQGRSVDADDTVEEFAWLLPVPKIPEVDVAPAMVFERLAQATEPVFELEDESTGDCPAEVSTFLRESVVTRSALGTLSSGAAPATQAVDHAAPVRAVDAGSVGPYEHVTIETVDGLDDSAEKAVVWLEEHGYRVESVDLDLLREYLDDGLNLLAMRLRSDAGAEDVQPVAITVEMEGPISPMRLARAGAAGQTDILVWAAGQGRALPHGWPRVEIDEGLVDWADGGSNYSEIVAAAVDEAGGRGFVTDYARATGETNGVLWSTEEQEKWEELRGRSDFEGAERETLETITELVGGEELLTQMLREEMPLPGRRELAEVIEVSEFSASYRPGSGGILDGPDPIDIDAVDILGDGPSVGSGPLGEPLGAERSEGRDEPSGENRDDGRDEPSAEERREERAQRQKQRRRRSGGGPEALLEALKGGQVLAACFARELEEEPTVHGEWSGRLRDPGSRDDVVDDVSSTLNSSFNGCIAHALRTHLEDVDYAPRAFPAEVSFRFTNPYHYVGDEMGYPALQASTYAGVDEVDWALMVEHVDEAIIKPLQSAQERLDATATLTRLSTAVQAQNLTKDVNFPLVPDHGDVPALRQATRRIECGGQEITKDKRIYKVRDWSLELERGQEVEGRGEGWPVAIGDREAARLIVEYDRWGQVVDERGDAVEGEVEYIEVDVEAMKADDENEEGEVDGADDEDTESVDVVEEADEDGTAEDATPWWHWLLGSLAAFMLVSLVLAALRREEA